MINNIYHIAVNEVYNNHYNKGDKAYIMKELSNAKREICDSEAKEFYEATVERCICESNKLKIKQFRDRDAEKYFTVTLDADCETIHVSSHFMYLSMLKYTEQENPVIITAFNAGKLVYVIPSAFEDVEKKMRGGLIRDQVVVRDFYHDYGIKQDYYMCTILGINCLRPEFYFVRNHFDDKCYEILKYNVHKCMEMYRSAHSDGDALRPYGVINSSECVVYYEDPRYITSKKRKFEETKSESEGAKESESNAKEDICSGNMN